MTDTEPFSAPHVRNLCREILSNGEVRFTKHARERMEQRGLEEVDITNVLRGGAVGPPEPENGTWRYTVFTPMMEVKLVFRSKRCLVIITAWKNDI